MVEGEPLAQRRQLLRLGVVREYARVHYRIVRAGEHVVGPLSRLRLAVPHPRRRPRGIAGRQPRLDAHVTVLACHARGGGRRVLVLAEGLLEPEPVDEIDVVA